MAAQAAERAVDEREAGAAIVILDSGILTVFEKRDVSGRGEMPRYEYITKTQGYYGELDFASGGVWTTQGREDLQIDTRVRILQDRSITPLDVVALDDVRDARDVQLYEIERIYHGRDEESGEKISDISLKKVSGR